MFRDSLIRPPFFEIGPKSYLYGDEIVELAKFADEASAEYGVNIIFTTPFPDIRRVREATRNIFVFAPHMDALRPGRGLADILPESIKAAGAYGVMLNHCERPLSLSALHASIARADELDLATIVCADSLAEARAVACLKPNIVVAEPTELIGTGQVSDETYVRETTKAVKDIDPEILVLQGAGISNGDDVYRTIKAGADATGSSSAVAKAPDRRAMVFEMISAVRRAWDEVHG